MPTKCPFCGNGVIEDRLYQGFVYCLNGHVLTVAPLHSIDPAVLIELACRMATAKQARGERVDLGTVGRWRSRANR